MKLNVKVFYRPIDRQGPGHSDLLYNDVVYSDSPISAKEIVRLMRDKHGLLIIHQLFINGDEVDLHT